MSPSGCSLFEDDILLHREGSCSLHTCVQFAMDEVSNWFPNNYMLFNTAKCNMVISRKRNQNIPYDSLVLNSVTIEKVLVFKYLGVWLSDKLKWSHRIDQTTKCATKQVGLIYRHFYSHLSQKILIQMYLSYVRPILEYAAPVWDPHQT